MEKRRLGRSGIEVAPLMLGGNVFGFTVDERRSFEILDAFVGEEFDFVDTADMYSRWAPGNRGGESETIIGNWMKSRGNRSRMIIATKVGMEMGPGQSGLKKDYILRAVEESLRRLRTDYIDLYQSHRDDPETSPEETLRAYEQLIRHGKVRVIGASNFSAARLRESLQTSARLGIPRYESLQPLYNLHDRQEFERELEPVCHEEGLGAIPYYSLASGFLTGKYRSRADLSKSVRGDRVEHYLDDRGFRILGALDRVARESRSRPACVALAWLLSKPVITAPIASATSLEQLNDLIAGARLRLARSSLQELDRASA